MKNKQILFTEPNVARLVDIEEKDTLDEHEVLVENEVTAVSAGTERANLIGEFHIAGPIEYCSTRFPRAVGYSGAGRVVAVGRSVTALKPGDRVIRYAGLHRKYDRINEENVLKIPFDNIPQEHAALSYIATFPLEGVRKTRLELGESGMVTGLGILGLFAVQMMKLGGAIPVIAADPRPERRELALKLGADYALDPLEDGFAAKVKRLTDGKGVDTAVEVTGVSAGLNETLACMAPLGRVTLLGCTRNPDAYTDYYHLVHFPGISIIGAHTNARPRYESRPGNWCYRDDFAALFKWMAAGRLNMDAMISEIHSPEDAPEVYHRLAFDKNFPIGVLFDWRGVTCRA